MKLIFTFSIIALSTTSILAQDKKPSTQPAHKTVKQHKPAAKAKKSVEPDEIPQEDQNLPMPSNKRMKRHTDLINVPENK